MSSLTLSRNGFAATALALSIAGATAALAHSGASGVVKSRMDAMSDIGKHMKIIGEMLRGSAPFEPAEIGAAALVVNEHAGSLPDLFPEGSLHGPTEAKPEIRSDWDRFVDYADQLEEASDALVEVADTGDREDIAATFGELGQACKGCHEAFRVAN